MEITEVVKNLGVLIDIHLGVLIERPLLQTNECYNVFPAMICFYVLPVQHNFKIR